MLVITLTILRIDVLTKKIHFFRKKSYANFRSQNRKKQSLTNVLFKHPKL